MSKESRRQIIAGNWKMNKTSLEAKEYIEKLKSFLLPHKSEVYLAVPFTALSLASRIAENSSIKIGAQNMNAAASGAFTGEIAATMLIDAGASFVILGHSERRQLFGESDEVVNMKLKRSLEENLEPIVCIGETLEERESGRMQEVLERQISQTFADIIDADMASLILAYEPVWAIGTGKTATPEVAQEAHAFIRKVIAKKWNPTVAEEISFLYGGSVKPDNAKELMLQQDIDGLLVGGASLAPDTFSEIVDAQATIPQL